MYSYHIQLAGGLNVCVNVPDPLFANEGARLLAGAYLPGAQFVDEPTCVPHHEIDFTRAEDADVNVGVYTVRVRGSWEREEDLLMDVLLTTYGTARQFWLRQHLYPVHAACVGGTLIVGHSGVGKTAITLELAARGRKVFSGNKTLVNLAWGQMEALAGTRTITTKVEDAQRNASLIREQIDYHGRCAFLLGEQMYCQEPLLHIGAVALPRLNDGVFERTTLNPVSALHRLYPYFLDAVNADIVLCGGSAVFPGTPPEGTQQVLAGDLRMALDAVPVLSLAGSMGFVTSILEVL